MVVFKNIIIISVFLLSSFPGYGQGFLKRDTVPINSADYYEDYKDLLTTRLYSIRKFNELKFSNSKSDTSIIYKPNEHLNLGVGFNYQSAGVNLAFNFKNINDDNDRYGETKNVDIQGSVYGKEASFDFYATYYKGYYNDNISHFDPSYSQVEYPYRADLSTFMIGANYYYVFQHQKFSYRASFVQNAWQKKSAGSFLLGTFITAFNVTADSSVVPLQLKSVYRGIDDIHGAFLVSTGYSLGYIYTFVFGQKKHWFLTLSLMPGFTYQLLSTQSEGYGEALIFEQASRVQSRIALGYNSERFYIGMDGIKEEFSLINQLSTGVDYSLGRIRLLSGYRFKIKK